MENKKDIFDKIMELPLINIFNPFYKKYKEQLLYLFFGFCTFMVSLIIFTIGCYNFNLEEITSNNISWVIAVLFAYVTNRTWVFTDKAHNFKGVLKEIFAFFAGRFFTLLVENGIIYVFITMLGFNRIVIKIIGQIVIIILNYIISKWLIFKKQV